ncbi:MAG: hypothetical protein ACPG4X_11705 [Pikeienuella sp.]
MQRILVDLRQCAAFGQVAVGNFDHLDILGQIISELSLYHLAHNLRHLVEGVLVSLRGLCCAQAAGAFVNGLQGGEQHAQFQRAFLHIPHARLRQPGFIHLP